MSLIAERLSIPGLLLIRPSMMKDDRGFFCETYKRSDFLKVGIEDTFVQDNHSYSFRNVLRGLHFQRPPHEQGKLIAAVKGRIWDVAVDIRQGSPTFGRWEGVELASDQGTMVWIPPGFAHGFLTLSDEVDVFYKCTSEYHAASESGIVWNDPDVGIRWPVREVIMSTKDRVLPALREARLW